MNEYKTLLKNAQTEYVIQKSRFIGHAVPVATADEALAFLDGIKKEHRSASHNCFAYIIGQNKGVIRYSDDGEPSGTAGKPIVEVMMAKEVVNCAVVITRYFGGILLGAGGLVRAYAHSTSLALEAAQVCTMHETGRWCLNIAYPLWDKVQHAFQSLPVMIESIAYTENVQASLLLRESDADSVIEALHQVTDGKLETDKDRELFFYPWGG